MLLAELEVRHSRAIAPTRRVALGSRWLPTDPAPGFGGILLAGLVAAHVNALEGDMRAGLSRLIDDLEAGRRIAQPRLRHRFQTDVVGLDRSRHKLVGEGERVRFELDDHGREEPQLLAAVYAAQQLAPPTRPTVFRLLRRAMAWEGAVDGSFVTWVAGDRAAPSAWRAFPTDERWALEVLGLGPDARITDALVRARFRELVRKAHPDHGAAVTGAGERILELTEARRILLQ